MLIRFIRPLILKTTMIVLTLKYFSQFSVISANTGSQKTPEQLPADIYQRFRIKNFDATFVESTILISWNIEPVTNSNRTSDPVRQLKIFENEKLVNETSITIEDFCKVNGYIRVTCQLRYPKEDCMNYKFTLGNKNNVACITTVPVKTNTITFELTDSETNPVEFTWKIECAANNMYFFSNNRTNNGKRFGLAVCNSEQQICELKLNTTFVCTTPMINIGGETISLNNEILYSLSNLSIDVSNSNQIGMEWMETVKIKCPVPSSSFNYNLVIKDNEKNQVVYHFSVPNWCVIDYVSPHNNKTQWRKLTFSRKGKILSCLAKTEYFGFNNTQLRPCVNYSVSISGSGNVNSIVHTSFMIRTLETEDIKNLHVVNLSSSRFELEWEIPADCLKVKNFTIPIENNYKSVENLSLSLNNTKCNDTTCTVRWMYNDLAECTLHAIKVSRATIYVTTPPPGAPIIINGSPKTSTSTNFEVEWDLPRQCQRNLTIQKLLDERNENSSFIGSASAIPISRQCNKYCHTRWRFDKELEPCTTYQLNLGVFTQEITTLPDISGGIVNEMTIRSKVPESADEPATLVIHWDHPRCKKTKDLKRKISIRKSLSNETIVKPISNLEYSYKYAGVKACETYTFAILTVLENGSTLYSTEEKNFQADCPTVELLVPISVIAVLMLIAILIALFFCKKRKKMEALNKRTEHFINEQLSLTESLGRILSISHSKRPSFDSHNSSSEYAEVDLDCLPQMIKRPLDIRDICSFDVGQAQIEFCLINNSTEIEDKIRLSRIIAERPENKHKNISLNSLPSDDFNRVLLCPSETDQNDGYINASFIPGFSGKEKEYIAAQGPKKNTLGDFWRMILEQDVTFIVMVGKALYECDKNKCEKYWPYQNELVVYDNIQLELVHEKTYSFFTTRNILVTKTQVKREIQQFHFTAWPDFEAPDQPEEFIRFIEIVRRQARQWKLFSPIVVHCSEGVGRTGTFIALDYLIQQVLITTDLVDIPKTVCHLRRFRLSMVQSEAQYIFLYTCVAHYVKTRVKQAKKKNNT